MKNYYLLAMGLMLTLFTSCYPWCDEDKDEDNNTCVSYHFAPVTAVSAPDTIAVNQTMPVDVSFACTSGCGQFGYFSQVTNGNTREINITAKYVGCFCTADVPIRHTNYNFRATSAGTYILEFKAGNNTYIRDTIVAI